MPFPAALENKPLYVSYLTQILKSGFFFTLAIGRLLALRSVRCPEITSTNFIVSSLRQQQVENHRVVFTIS